MHTDSRLVVRAAQEGDAPQLCPLCFEFHEYHVLGAPDRLATLGRLDRFVSSELRGKLEEIIRSYKSDP